MRTQKVYFWQKWSYQALQQCSAQNDSNLVHCSLGKFDNHGIRESIALVTVRKICPYLINWNHHWHHCNSWERLQLAENMPPPLLYSSHYPLSFPEVSYKYWFCRFIFLSLNVKKKKGYWFYWFTSLLSLSLQKQKVNTTSPSLAKPQHIHAKLRKNEGISSSRQ